MTSDNAFFKQSLQDADPAIFKGIQDELHRQQTQIELIASENIASKATIEALGTVFTNKYAEGYPGKRYYGGCEFADVVEQLAIDRVNKLFGSKFANVQPHSGAQANGAVMLALVKPGDTILGMSLATGGHLTHGAAPAMSGKWFNAIQYGVHKDTQLLDYEAMEALAREHKPKLIIAGASAYPRQIDFARFRKSLMKLALCSWLIWLTTLASLLLAHMNLQFRTRMLQLQQRIKLSVAHVAVSSSLMTKISSKKSNPQYFQVYKAAHW